MNGKTPVIDPTAYIATSASVVGDVQIATGSAVWYGSIVRGDENSVMIGTESHIQDRSVVSGVKSTEDTRRLFPDVESMITATSVRAAAFWRALTWRRTPLSVRVPCWSRERPFLPVRWVAVVGCDI